MEIFTKKFNESDQVNRTSTARYNRPPSDQSFNQPAWQIIQKPGAERSDDVNIEQVTSGESVDHDQVRQNGCLYFDEDELARMLAKVWHVAFTEGQWQARAELQSDATELANQIDQRIAGFAQSVRLPVGAIRQELTALLQALAEEIALPGDEARYAEALKKAVNEFLNHADTPSPLTLHINAQDAERVEDLLTKLADSRGEGELRIVVEPERNAGEIAVGWPGGGMERLVKGRLAAIQNVLKSLSENDPERPDLTHPPGDEL